MLPRFEYYEPTTILEACSFLAEKGAEAQVLAGGTDLLAKMKERRLRIQDRRLRPRFLVNIKRIADLEGVSFNGGLRLGALTTIHTLETSPEIRRVYPALAYAASTIGSVQVRNLATVGGNLCNAAPSADTASILMALSARTLLQDCGGRRRIVPLDDFFLGPGETVLQPGEILTEIEVPPAPPQSTASYYKLINVREGMDLATVGVAVLVQVDGDTCKDCRIVLGAVAPTPLRARRAEEVLLGQRLTPELIRQSGEMAAREAKPITDIRASADYRREMVKVITRRALEQATEQARRQK